MIKTFEISSGKIVASDPCYQHPDLGGVWCQGIVENVENGTWGSEIKLSNEGDWGIRVASLFICNQDAFDKDNKISEKIFNGELLNFSAGVDSGQFGFFDFAHYRNDESAKDLEKEDFGFNYDSQEGDKWYRACSNLTLGDEQWGVLPNGVVSSSGLGDGSYDVYGYKNAYDKYVAFVVVFIYDDENEEDEDEDWETVESVDENE